MHELRPLLHRRKYLWRGWGHIREGWRFSEEEVFVRVNT
ncbi:hypothetical protein L21SP2_0685 [Salinispira pacifica]|uniref:Uncharacterized protein n=1 Tax=Salinispira pacifica TaxID=1307761 RepID=V5WE93_9SPIO|nr:hypothetical protein L21SP2_0685 [Salinispira pacifica]